MNTKITKPIKVICIDNRRSIKLVKGAIYDMTSKYTYIGNTKIYLKGVGSYNTKYFTLLDGTPLKTLQDFHISHINNSLNVNNNYKNKYVKCKYDSGKFLKGGEIYLVEDQIKTTIKNNWSQQIQHELKVKIRGMKNFTSIYKFKELSPLEQRNIKLKKIKGEKLKTGDQTRKFLLYSEKEKIKILLDILYKIINDIINIKDINNNKIDIIDIFLKKGKLYNIIKEDITEFLYIIKPLLKPFEDLIKL